MVRIVKLAAVVALVTALSGCIFPPPGGGGGGWADTAADQAADLSILAKRMTDIGRAKRLTTALIAGKTFRSQG